MKKYSAFFVLLVLVAVAASGLEPLSDFPAKAKGDIDFTVDLVRFRNPMGRNLVQVSYALPYRQLSPAGKEEEGHGVAFEVGVKVKSLDTTSVQEDSWMSHGRVRTSEETGPEKASGVDQFEIELGGGNYELTVTITDSMSGKSGSAKGRVALPPLGQDLALSDLQLATSVEIDTVGSNFTRGNVKAIPNPNRLFGDNMPFVYVRFEIYNMEYDSASPGTYATTYSILDQAGTTVTSLPTSDNRKIGHTGVAISAVNVLGLKPGKYVFRTEVRDVETSEVTSSTSEFEVSMLRRRRPPMSGWAEEYFSRIDLLVGQDTLRFMKSLSPDGQEEFLMDFWLRRDPTPGTPTNEYFDAFAARIREADKKFKSGFEKGVDSDRGRIYIKYGNPDDTEYHPQDPDYPANEDWFYYREGGIQFIFCDISGIGKYELVYSSTGDENCDPNWRQYINEEFIRKSR
jgi:GWxTD domain-containing protein